MLRFSELLDLCFRIIGQENIWQIDRLYPMMAWSYENGFWACLCRYNKWAIIFWTYCNEIDAKKIIETQDYMLYLTVLLRKQLNGKIMIPYLVLGNIDILCKKILKDIMHMTNTDKILYYKTKTSKFYLQEVK